MTKRRGRQQGANQGGGGNDPKQHLEIELTTPEPVGETGNFTVKATAWYKENNIPKRDKVILFYLNGADLRDAQSTGDEGEAETVIELGPGTHTVTAKVKGWGTPRSKNVTIERKKKAEKPTVKKIEIVRTKLRRSADGTTYSILLRALDAPDDGKGVTGVKLRVTDPSAPEGFVETGETDQHGTVVHKTTVTKPGRLTFTATAHGASAWEFLFHSKL